MIFFCGEFIISKAIYNKLDIYGIEKQYSAGLIIIANKYLICIANNLDGSKVDRFLCIKHFHLEFSHILSCAAYLIYIQDIHKLATDIDVQYKLHVLVEIYETYG